jgi:hypothetical protein
MKILMRTLILLCIIFTCVQCQKQIDLNVPDTITSNETIVANIQGIVLDENNLPSIGATVIVGSKTTTTNSDGFFKIAKASLDKSSAVVKIKKAGYFDAYRTFIATAATNHVSMKLIKKEIVGTVNSATGGFVTLTNGSKITLQANGVVKKTGAAFSGTVNVYAAYINPTASDIDATMPGSYMADDANGKRVVLKSYGMLAVELESTTGEKLQIAEGKTAELNSPIPSSLLASSPSTIALWYVDEQTGIWKEQGTATKIGNNYVGNVSHFSFWNCDIGLNAVTLSMRITTSTNIPLANVRVNITRANNVTACGFTDSDGYVSGLVPANENLTLRVLDNCNNVAHTQSINALTQNTNLGTIALSSLANNVYEVSGNLVNCNAQPVTNGEVAITINGFERTVPVNNNSGSFALAFLKCNTTPENISVLGIDNINQQQSNSNQFVLSNTNLNVGSIVACGASSNQFLNYNLDGTNYSINPASVLDSSMAATYAYSQNGFDYSTNFAFIVNNNLGINFRFLSNGQVSGNYSIQLLGINNFYFGTTVINSSLVNITNFALNNTQYYEGSFSVNFSEFANPTAVHNCNGVFRLRRRN